MPRIARIHSNIQQRCTNPKHPYFYRYGGRGITLCDEWRKLADFRKWALSSGYSESLTIDRIDNDRGYSPENCRWVSMKVNANNRSSSHKVHAFGETHSLTEWSEILGISYNTLKKRVIAGEPDGEHLLRPSRRARR